VFKDIEHLIRLAVVIVVLLAIFMVLRAVVVPRSFGEYGHYRGAAIAEAAARPVAFAGHDACEGCHSDVADQKKQGKHVVVACEACHGALAKHADDPASVTPVKPDVAKLCVQCHSQNIAKPSGFPQVDAKEHAEGQPCNTCHQPHSPGFDAGGKK
jgi:hypothetical protein